MPLARRYDAHEPVPQAARSLGDELHIQGAAGSHVDELELNLGPPDAGADRAQVDHGSLAGSEKPPALQRDDNGGQGRRSAGERDEVGDQCRKVHEAQTQLKLVPYVRIIAILLTICGIALAAKAIFTGILDQESFEVLLVYGMMLGIGGLGAASIIAQTYDVERLADGCAVTIATR